MFRSRLMVIAIAALTLLRPLSKCEWVRSGAMLAFCAFVAVTEASAAPTVVLERPVHFLGIDGTSALANPDTYLVEVVEPSHLRLITSHGKAPLVIQAEVTTYELEEMLTEPVVLSVPAGEDEHHVVLVLPGGKGFDAVGSTTGVRPRGTGIKPLTSAQVKAALRATRAH